MLVMVTAGTLPVSRAAQVTPKEKRIYEKDTLGHLMLDVRTMKNGARLYYQRIHTVGRNNSGPISH